MRGIKVGRTLPPAAAPLGWRDIWNGVGGSFRPARAYRAREAEIRHEFGVRHVFLVSSGSAALVLALLALKSRSTRTDVVIPAYTCFSLPAREAARSAMVGACNSVAIGRLRPKVCRTRLISCMASKECPPSSKKLS